MHPLIRFLLRSRVDEKYPDLHKLFISYLFLFVGVTMRSAESLSSAIPLGTSTKRANSKRANHSLSADDGHDHCLQCLGFQNAEDAFVDDCCGRMSMTSRQSRLSFLKGLAPSVATRALFSGSSREPPAGALGDLKV